ncbi:MAG: EutN/CcmL family microcompartment protein [Pirellulaceae bacterium]|jgi:ethanolamine utilization protein EutN|nr:EutN/CcmL family microcompartment protein [Mariniblastus sp.]MDB4756618.1 EutN/CcmL family microcompartment protein [Mariniblastus sp.]MDG2470461.1 EutN/CcmL family microcompartment protein [Pirellulaceae bacterium]
MLKATVIGRTTSTLKHKSISGQKLLIVQPQMQDGSPEGDPLIAIDGVGSGVGEQVFITSDGRNARALLNTDATPVRWSIIGIKD